MMLLSLLPFADVKEPELQEMERFIAAETPFRARREPPLPLPESAHDAKRGQYDGTLLLRTALANHRPDAVRLLAVTEQDLFIPMLTFIFGQAQLDGTAAIVSLARLRPEFHGLPHRRDIFVDRYRKEILHELGHTCGLTHCADSTCAMSLSIKIANIDAKRAGMCPDCRLRLDTKLAALSRESGAEKE